MQCLKSKYCMIHEKNISREITHIKRSYWFNECYEDIKVRGANIKGPQNLIKQSVLELEDIKQVEQTWTVCFIQSPVPHHLHQGFIFSVWFNWLLDMWLYSISSLDHAVVKSDSVTDFINSYAGPPDKLLFTLTVE